MKEMNKSFKEARKQSRELERITSMLGGLDTNFKMLGTGMRLNNRIKDLMDYKDIIDSEELSKQLINMLEQFEQMINDFVKENNISEDNLLSEYIGRMEDSKDE